jgi:hypothetical protein
MSQAFIALDDAPGSDGRWGGMLVIEDQGHELAEYSGATVWIELQLGADSPSPIVGLTRPSVVTP